MKIEKCPQCGIETKALHLHLKKHEKDEANKRVEILEKNVSDIMTILSKVADKVLTEPKKDLPEQIKEIEAQPNSLPVDPVWRAAVDEYLGKDFGLIPSFHGGKVLVATIIVPREKSNMPKDSWEFYKADLRTIVVGNEGLDALKKGLDRIKKNLKL